MIFEMIQKHSRDLKKYQQEELLAVFVSEVGKVFIGCACYEETVISAVTVFYGGSLIAVGRVVETDEENRLVNVRFSEWGFSRAAITGQRFNIMFSEAQIFIVV